MPVKNPTEESGEWNRRERSQLVYNTLLAEYPDATCALDYKNAFEMLCAVILSAQCTDARVNQVTPHLFQRFPNPQLLADAHLEELESIIRSTGFFKNKARSLKGMAQALCRDHDGEVPSQLEALIKLPGVGRKTANVILGNIFGIPGMVVDTHVGRLSRLLGFTQHEDPEKIERDLQQIFLPEQWTMLSHLLIAHGRAVCNARKPKCEACVLAGDCPSAGFMVRC